jgi:valine--pyruvate aminotransferase
MSDSKFAYSDVGKRLSGRVGIVELMDDLGEALSGAYRGEMRMLGGGNPAAVPEVQEVWRERLSTILAEADYCDRVLVNYDGPAGSPAFREIVAEAFQREFGWNVTAKNIAITSGGQTAFFQLFNLLGGTAGKSQRKILLPIMPEYIGYSDQGVALEMFAGCQPEIEYRGDHEFKYHVDFARVEEVDSIGAIALSRPTNPSGNVLTNDEVEKLREVAKKRSVPLLLDNAYGLPFPGAIFTDAELPRWDEDLVLVFSLSKLGLPGTRTAIVVAHEEIADRVAAMTAVIGLANNNIGQAIAGPLLKSGELLRLSREVIKPFYERRAKLALEIVAKEFGEDFPYRVHATEGAFFLWMWFPELPITSRELYERLKRKNMLLVPGEYFFFGLPANLDWPHRHQCVRVTFSQSEATVADGLRIMAKELRQLHATRVA